MSTEQNYDNASFGASAPQPGPASSDLRPRIFPGETGVFYPADLYFQELARREKLLARHIDHRDQVIDSQKRLIDRLLTLLKNQLPQPKPATADTFPYRFSQN
ncbi:hypothetical protein [Larkinella soli]|uniref:hypothetical protein n=1 Tax=Larkinella soli TaxID=1770527 RepID=UPI000FFB0EAC|nr:hypothetical protein [Larkinella soli]